MWRFELARVNPIKLAYDPHQPDGWLPLTASAFNRLRQYAGSPSNRAYCYAELTVSSLEVAETIVSILIVPTHGRMARLRMPGWFD